MRTAVSVLLCLMLASAGLFGWFYLVREEPVRFGAAAVPEKPNFLLVVYGYVVTLVGVFIGSAYRELQLRRGAGEVRLASIRSFFAGVLHSLDFWLGVCGSPLVYALIWRSLDGGSLASLTVIAIENGFCCTMVVNAFLGRQTASGQAPPPTGGGAGARTDPALAPDSADPIGRSVDPVERERDDASRLTGSK